MPAYAVGVLLNNFSVRGFSLSILMAPNMLSDPDYKLPDDGLDPSARKMVVSPVACVMTVTAVIAIASNFKI